MPTTFSTRPDSNFYIHIQQHDDGSWSADPMPLDDVIVTIPMIGDVASKGLRSITKENIDSFAAQSVLVNAPPDMQRNSLYIVSQGTGATGYASAKACMDWVTAMNAYRDTQKTAVNTMTFDQLVVYTVTSTGWPAVPSNMPPKAASAETLFETRLVRPYTGPRRPEVTE